MSAWIGIISKYTWTQTKKIKYVYVPLRQVKICVCIEMLYVTSGDIYYLCLILLNRKAHSDNNVLTYTPVCGGGHSILVSALSKRG